jgi:hypothetical protein
METFTSTPPPGSGGRPGPRSSRRRKRRARACAPVRLLRGRARGLVDLEHPGVNLVEAREDRLSQGGGGREKGGGKKRDRARRFESSPRRLVVWGLPPGHDLDRSAARLSRTRAEPRQHDQDQRATLLHAEEPSSLALATVALQENLIRHFHEFRLARNLRVALRGPSDGLSQDRLTFLTRQRCAGLQSALCSLGHDSTFPLTRPSVEWSEPDRLDRAEEPHGEIVPRVIVG